MSVVPLPASRRTLLMAALVLGALAVGALSAPALAAVSGPTGGVEEPGLAVADGAAARRFVEILPLRDGLVDPPVAAQIGEVLDLAESDGSELVVLQYSSGGGVSLDVDELLARVRTSGVPVAALVGPLGTQARAAGAAGLLWLAADVRALSVDATVGPLSPADLAGDEDPSVALERIRELLDAAGVDISLAERLRDEAVPAEELAEAVTLDAQGLEPLLVELDGVTVVVEGQQQQLRLRADEMDVRFHSLGLVRRLLHAATTGPFIYLLLVVGLGMLLFELFQPGFGVAGIAGLVILPIGVFGLVVLPVVWWGVALVVLGLLLYALDTAVAGFGPLTAAATAAVVVGSMNFYASDALALSGWLIAATVATLLVFFVFVMTSLLRAQAGPEGVAVEDLVGRPGIVRSALNPEGHVYIDGALWRARWTGDAQRAKVGTPVRVHGVDGALVLVEPFEVTSGAAGGTGGDERHDGDEGGGTGR